MELEFGGRKDADCLDLAFQHLEHVFERALGGFPGLALDSLPLCVFAEAPLTFFLDVFYEFEDAFVLEVDVLLGDDLKPLDLDVGRLVVNEPGVDLILIEFLFPNMLADNLSDETKILSHFLDSFIRQIGHSENAAIFSIEIWSFLSFRHISVSENLSAFA